MPAAQVSADMREMRQKITVAKALSSTLLATTSVPVDSIEMWKAEIAALPVRKRKNWKGSMTDRFGVRGVVVYDPQGIEVPGYGRTHFKQRMNEQKKSMYATEQEWRPVMPMGWQQQEPAGGLNIWHIRTGTDATMDGHTPQIQHDMLETEKRANQMGNHEPRNHPIHVPTAPGEPCRG